MNILIVHQNFPGQFKHLAPALAADKSNRVVAIGEATNLKGRTRSFPGIELHGYPPPKGASTGTHHYLKGFEAGVRRGQAAYRLAAGLRKQGFRPDLILCHPGWGEGLYLKELFPCAKLLSYFEFFYHPTGVDVGFDPEFPATEDDLLRVNTKNALNLFNLTACDWGLAPTRWQHSLHPAEYRDRISVIFDGIRTDQIVPNPAATVTLKTGVTLARSDEVITFVARSLEPYRGFHVFLRSLVEIQQRRPKAQVLIIGREEVSYGRKLAQGSYKEQYLAELGNTVDLGRVHFLGNLPYQQYLEVLQLSSVHVYLTYPFVLSWSLLEAMSAGCAVIGSRTPPVEEVLVDGANGLLVDFFSTEQLADAVDRVLDHPDRLQHLREAARRTAVDHYDLQSVCLPRQLALINALVQGVLPSKPSLMFPSSPGIPGLPGSGTS
ncbi:MAG: glycosyltransferase [Methylococcaceae bacterium]|nr:glycosyltransferase [Methylococcaceae bacterium]